MPRIMCIILAIISMRIYNYVATNPFPPPNVVNLTSITGRQISFNWTSSLCSSIEYIIMSDCGVCPASTNSSSVMCTDFQLPTDSGDTECAFTVNSRVCDITSDLSSAIVLRGMCSMLICSNLGCSHKTIMFYILQYRGSLA